MYLEPFEKVLQRDAKRIPALLEYVRYPYNTRIQQEAISIAQQLDDRLPNMVLQLVPPRGPGFPKRRLTFVAYKHVEYMTAAGLCQQMALPIVTTRLAIL